MNINEILKIIKTTLNISDNILENIITNKNLTKEQLDTKYDSNITDLIKNNVNNFKDFETKIQGEDTKKNFNKFKENIGRLQVLVLIKKLEKSTNCDEIIKSFLDVLNPNIETLISIQDDQLGIGANQVDNDYDDLVTAAAGTNKSEGGNRTQLGGGDNYYNKYLKYKKKYFILKEKLI